MRSNENFESLILGVSVRQRMSDYGLAIRAQYCNLTSEELDEIVGDIQT